MRFLVLLALSVACSAAVAGPPFLTDDPELVDPKHAEINLIGQQLRATGGRRGSVSGEVNFGCAAETQCHVAVTIAFDHPADGSSNAGVGDIEFGMRYRFLDRPDDGWPAALYPTLDLPTRDSSRGRGLDNGRAHLLLSLWVQRSAGAWSRDAGIAQLIDRAPDARDSRLAGLLAQRSFGDALSLGAEVFRRTTTAVGQPSAAGFNVGTIVKIASNQNLLVSAGRGLTHIETNRCSMFLAYQLEL